MVRSFHLLDLRGHPGAIEDGLLAPVAADVEGERAVRRGQPEWAARDFTSEPINQ